MRSKLLVTLGIAALSVMAFAGNALAVGTSYDFSPVTTPFSDQISSTVATALPVAGGIMALFVGWRILKRLVKG